MYQSIQYRYVPAFRESKFQWRMVYILFNFFGHYYLILDKNLRGLTTAFGRNAPQADCIAAKRMLQCRNCLWPRTDCTPEGAYPHFLGDFCYDHFEVVIMGHFGSRADFALSTSRLEETSSRPDKGLMDITNSKADTHLETRSRNLQLKINICKCRPQ